MMAELAGPVASAPTVMVVDDQVWWRIWEKSERRACVMLEKSSGTKTQYIDVRE